MFYLELNGNDTQADLQLRGVTDEDIEKGRLALRRLVLEYAEESDSGENLYITAPWLGLLACDTSTKLPADIAMKILEDKADAIPIIEEETKLKYEAVGDDFIISYLGEFDWHDLRSKDDTLATMVMGQEHQFDTITDTLRPTIGEQGDDNTTLGFIEDGEYRPFVTILSGNHPVNLVTSSLETT